MQLWKNSFKTHKTSNWKDKEMSRLLFSVAASSIDPTQRRDCSVYSAILFFDWVWSILLRRLERFSYFVFWLSLSVNLLRYLERFSLERQKPFLHGHCVELEMSTRRCSGISWYSSPILREATALPTSTWFLCRNGDEYHEMLGHLLVLISNST